MSTSNNKTINVEANLRFELCVVTRSKVIFVSQGNCFSEIWSGLLIDGTTKSLDSFCTLVWQLSVVKNNDR